MRYCPHCNTDLNGEKIPEESRGFFGDKTHFSRLMGIEDGSYDGVSYWRCPDCGVVWDRFTGEISKSKTIEMKDWVAKLDNKSSSVN